MKIIKFNPELAELIKSGEKRSTFRLFDDKNLKEGDEFIMAMRRGKNVIEFGNAIITRVILRTIETLSPDDFEDHEYLENTLEYFRRFYGDKVQNETEVKIIKFDVLLFY